MATRLEKGSGPITSSLAQAGIARTEQAPGSIRIMIVDDDPQVRVALAEFIEGERALQFVGAASGVEEAVGLAHETQPDVALVDVMMPGGGGSRASREIQRSSPRTRVLALSAHNDGRIVSEMLQAGATGYVLKTDPPEDLVNAIHHTAHGERALSTHIHLGSNGKGSGTPVRMERERRWEIAERIDRAMQPGSLEIAFQPIASLRTGHLIGLEALSRFQLDPPQRPDLWFADAAAVGMRVNLELRAVETALAHLRRIPAPAYLAVNVSPDAAVSPRLFHLLANVADRIVLELTEHTEVADYAALNRSLQSLRDRGARVAIDDAGAGFASFRHVLLLTPEIIKLDTSLTRGIDSDRARRSLASALISFASEIGATVVAEGIETRDELDILRSLGVRYGQGYHLAPPAPLGAGVAPAHLRIPIDTGPAA